MKKLKKYSSFMESNIFSKINDKLDELNRKLILPQPQLSLAPSVDKLEKR